MDFKCYGKLDFRVYIIITKVNKSKKDQFY